MADPASTSIESRSDAADRAIAGWEIASVASSILMAEWLAAATTGGSRLVVAAPVILALTFILFSHRLHRETLRDLGIRIDNFLRAVKLLLLPMVGVTLLAVVVSFLFGGRPDFLRWHSDRSLFAQLAISAGWGFAQHYVLQGFVNRRAQLIWGTGAASIAVTAIIFALLHLPNPTLVVATLLGGTIWAAVYQRAPNLLALALSHSVMSWVLVSTLPESILNHSRIGFKYFF